MRSDWSLSWQRSAGHGKSRVLMTSFSEELRRQRSREGEVTLSLVPSPAPSAVPAMRLLLPEHRALRVETYVLV